MDFVYSKHALIQIELRNLPVSTVEDVLRNPDRIINDVADVLVYQKVVIEAGKSYLYRVFVNASKTPGMVITAYRTSKTDKYENKI